LPAAESQRRERRWAQIAGDEPTGKTLGVLGFGLVGQRVARGARALEMTVIGADIVAPPRDAPCDRFVDTASGLPETLLAEIDALVITAALTPATRGLVDARALGRMKPSAVVVNVSRGPIINESDLVAALLAGGIAGAGLDVASPEPPHRDSPLWTLPNVILTPHMAWSSPMVEQRVAELIVANYRRLGAGQPLLNLVDKRAVE
jgi:phosphoglycerate dehydrogenase-like enzyme